MQVVVVLLAIGAAVVLVLGMRMVLTMVWRLFFLIFAPLLRPVGGHGVPPLYRAVPRCAGPVCEGEGAWG